MNDQFVIALAEENSAVTVGASKVDLTGAEFRVLKALTGKPNTVVSRTELTFVLYSAKESTAESNVLEVLVSRVRKKFAALGAPAIIKTVRGIGYSFVGQVQNAPAA